MDCVAHVKQKSMKWKGGLQIETSTSISALSLVLVAVVLLWFGLSVWTWWADATDYVSSLLMASSKSKSPEKDGFIQAHCIYTCMTHRYTLVV